MKTGKYLYIAMEPETRQQIEELAKREKRSVAKEGLRLIELGLQALEREKEKTHA